MAEVVQRHPNEAHGMDAPQVRTLLLTDIVDSTSLVERLGEQNYLAQTLED